MSHLLPGKGALPSVAEVRKLIVYVVTVAAEAVSLGILHGDALRWANGGIALAGAVGIFAARNAAPKP
jgi:hypothetical protein